MQRFRILLNSDGKLKKLSAHVIEKYKHLYIKINLFTYTNIITTTIIHTDSYRTLLDTV